MKSGHTTKITWLVLATLLCAPADAESSSSCRPTVESSRTLVLDFYREALIRKRPRIAFERYMSPDFVEHKQDVPEGTRTAVAAFLEGLMQELPQARWEILRSVAEPGLVMLHVRFEPAPGAPAYMIVDVFRVEGCRIVEHWDVVAPPRDPVSSPGSQK